MARTTAAPAKKTAARKAPAKQSARSSAGRSTPKVAVTPKQRPAPPSEEAEHDNAAWCAQCGALRRYSHGPCATCGHPGPTEGGEAEGEDYDGQSADDLHAARFGLRRTGIPGVYVNRSGNRVNRNNVLLSMLQLKAAERDHAEEVIGEPVDTPAELLRLVALDPTQPLALRIECAKSAAPYYDRKMPIGIEGGAPERPVTVETAGILKRLNELPANEKRMAFKLLETLGVIAPAKGIA